MATNANEVLDRLDALLAAATPGPWSYDDGVTDGDRSAGERGKYPWVTTTTGNRMICQPDGDADSDVKEPLLPTTAEMDGNGDLIAALRNAAPALIRLARGAMEMVGCAERCEKGEDISQAQVDAMGAEIESAAKALGEVRL